MAGESLHQQLLDGFDVKSRQDGTVHTIKRDGKTVAEVCVGVKKVRLSLRATVKAPKGIELGGKSKSWVGGGVNVTDENVKTAGALLEAVARPPAAKKPAVRRSSRKVAAAA